MTRSQLLMIGSGAFLATAFLFAGVGCGPTNTSHTEYHEHTDTTTGGSGPTTPNQNPPPVIEEHRSAPETIVQ